MELPFRAYWADWATARAASSARATGEIVTADEPLAVGRSLDDALAGGPGWPVALYEVEVLPEYPPDGHESSAPRVPVDPRLRVRGFRILRQVPLQDAFGPHAATLATLLEQLRHYPWLAPPAPPDDDHVAELVDAHYDALARYAHVTKKPHEYVRRWEEALDIHRDTILEEGEDQRRARACIAQALKSMDEGTHHANVGMQVAPYHVAYRPAWEAAWREVARSCLLHDRPRLEQVRREFLEACEQSPDSPWTTAQALEELFHRDKPPKLDLIWDIVTRPGHDLSSSWLDACDFAHTALHEASCATRHLVGLDERPDPSIPLLELFRLGLWPLGEHRGSFAIYYPQGASPTPDAVGGDLVDSETTGAGEGPSKGRGGR